MNGPLHPLVWLILCHCVFDYPLQGTFLAQLKAKYNFLLFVHALAWGFGMAATLQFLGLCTTNKVWFLVLGHFAMDWYKCHKMVPHLQKFFFPKSWGKHYGIDADPLINDPLCLPLWIDQAFHLLQMWMVL